MERACIYIDGGNFYHLVLKKLKVQESDFDYEGFAKLLLNGKELAECGKRFYVGTVREKEGDVKSREAMSRQTKLFNNLKQEKWEIKTSKLRIRMEELIIDSRVADYKKFHKLGIHKISYERLREKGIDVKIATDLIVGAIDNKYDIAIVVSSDSDLLPAIDWVRYRTKKKVEYIGFSILDKDNPEKSTKPLLSMIPRTDIQRTLIESELKQFIKQTLF